MIHAVAIFSILVSGQSAQDETLPMPTDEGTTALRILFEHGVKSGALQFLPRAKSGKPRVVLVDADQLATVLQQQRKLVTPAMCDALVTTSRTMDQAVLLEAVAALRDDNRLLAFAALARAESLETEGNYPASVKKYAEAARRFETLQFFRWKATTLTSWAAALNDQGEHASALERNHEVLTIAIKTHGRAHRETALCLTNIGSTLRELGRPNEARTHFQDALKILTELDDEPVEPIAGVHKNLSTLATSQRDYQTALEHDKKALDFAKRIPDEKRRVARVGDALSNLGNTQLHLRQFGAARESFELSLELLGQAHKGPDEHVAAVLHQLGSLHYALGDRRLCLDNLTRSLQMLIDLYGDRDWKVVEGFSQLAAAQLYFGNRTLARQYFGDARRISELLGGPNHAAVGESLGGLAEVAYMLGDYHQAFEFAAQERSICRLHEDSRPGELAECLNRLGMILHRLARNDEALVHFQTALDTWQKLKRDSDIAHGWHNLGTVHSEQREFEKADKAFQQALTIRQQMQPRNELDIASSLNSLGSLEYERANYADACDYHLRAWRILRNVPDAPPQSRAATLNNLGMSYYGMKRWRMAGEVFDEAIFHLRTRQRDRAPPLDSPQFVYGFSPSDLVPSRLTVQVLEQRGMAMWHNLPKSPRHQDWSPVSYSFVSAISVLENLKSHVLESTESRWEVAEDYSNLHAMLVGCHDRMRKISAATAQSRQHEANLLFKSAELGSGRGLLLMLARSRADVLAGLAEDLRKKYADLNAALSQLEGQLVREQSRRGLERNFEEVAALISQRGRLQEQLKEWRDDVKQKHPQFEQWQSPLSCSLAEARQYLGGNEVALIYVLGAAWSYVVLVDPSEPDVAASVIVAQLPGADEIEALVSTVTDRDFLDLATGHETLLEAYRMLVAPVAHRVRNRSLVIVPAGDLWKLPFAMLVEHVDATKNEVRFLVETHRIRYAPSISVLRLIQAWQSKRSSPSLTLWALGDPVYHPADDRLDEPSTVSTASQKRIDRYLAEMGRDLPRNRLPNAELEIRRIADRLNVPYDELALGTDASEARVKRASHSGELAKARYVHFATHGILGSSNDVQPSLILNLVANDTEDGFLQLDEAMQLRLNADLVVLSACQTGRGQLYRGEGVRGLAQAFLYAGSRGVLCSLWNVSDGATAELMSRIYSELSNGKPADAALQAAQLEMIRGGHRPAVWAPFVLIGE